MHLRQSFVREISTFAAGVFIVAGFASPVHAATNVAVDQVLPPQGETCSVLGATDIRTFSYDGALHSFEIGISDPSYVAVAAQAGNQSVPFNQITRRFDQNGNLTIHVDVATTPLVSDIPVSVTLISAQQGITCVASVSSVVPRVVPPPPAPKIPKDNASGGVSRPVSRPAAPAYPWGEIVYDSEPKATAPVAPIHENKSPKQIVAEKPLKPVPSLVTATHALGDTCKTAAGASKLWTVLLVLYAVFVALVAYLRRGHESESPWSIPLTVLGFLGLLLLWYLSSACRTGAWAPIAATIIACAGLIAMTFEEEAAGSVLLLKDSANPSR